MPVPIYNAARGLSEKPPRLVEFSKALKDAAKEFVEAAKKRAEEAVIKKAGNERK